jgi:hypothetical protein
MYQGAAERPWNHSEQCQARKVASLLAEPPLFLSKTLALCFSAFAGVSPGNWQISVNLRSFPSVLEQPDRTGR